MNKRQVGCIKASFRRDKNPYYSTMFNGTLMRKTIPQLVKQTRARSASPGLIVEVGKNTFREYSVDVKHTSNILYVITKNDQVIYYTLSSIKAPAASAFQFLTNVKQGYERASDSATWAFFSPCANITVRQDADDWVSERSFPTYQEEIDLSTEYQWV